MSALDSYIPGGKYSSARDAYLHAMCMEGWANESTGDVDSPSGHVYRVSNAPAELAEIVEAFGEASDRPQFMLADSNSILGHFLVTETDQGFVYVDRYDTEFLLINAYRALESAYDDWAGQDD